MTNGKKIFKSLPIRLIFLPMNSYTYDKRVDNRFFSEDLKEKLTIKQFDSKNECGVIIAFLARLLFITPLLFGASNMKSKLNGLFSALFTVLLAAGSANAATIYSQQVNLNDYGAHFADNPSYTVYDDFRLGTNASANSISAA